ncbi:MAG: SAM-dependent methyltransferase, partial [Oscillospiraceae bacterium]
GFKNYTKTKPIKIDEFDAEKTWWCAEDKSKRKETDCAWKVSIEDIKARNYNLDFKNPNKENEDELLTTGELIAKFKTSYSKVSNLIHTIEKELVENETL